VISLTDFFDAASWRHNDVILLPAMRRVSDNDFVPAGQCTAHCAAHVQTVELLRQETPNFLASKLWLPNSLDLRPVDYKIWAVMQRQCVMSTADKSIVWMNWNGDSSMSSAVLNSQFLSRVSTLTRDIDIAILSVRLSVRNVPVSDENGLTCRHSFFTIR